MTRSREVLTPPADDAHRLGAAAPVVRPHKWRAAPFMGYIDRGAEKPGDFGKFSKKPTNQKAGYTDQSESSSPRPITTLHTPTNQRAGQPRPITTLQSHVIPRDISLSRGTNRVPRGTI